MPRNTEQIRARVYDGCAALLIAAVLLMLGFRNMWWHTNDSYANRVCWDHWVLQSIAGFAEQGGLRKNNFLPSPIIDDGGGIRYAGHYAHTPPGNEIFYTTLYELGLKTVHRLRGAAILLNVLALAVLYAAFARLVNRPFALTALALVAANSLFWEKADSLYEPGFQWPHQALLLFGLALLTTDRLRSGTLLVWLAAFWQGAVAATYHIQTLFVIAGVWLTLKNRLRLLPRFALAATGGFVAVALHFLQTAKSYGGVGAAFADWTNVLRLRAFAQPTMVEPDETMNFASYGDYLVKVYHRYLYDRGIDGALALPVLLAFAVLLFAVYVQKNTTWRKHLVRYACLVAGASAWVLLMREDSYRCCGGVRHELSLMLLVAYAIVLAAWLGWLGWLGSPAAGARPQRAAALLLAPFIFYLACARTADLRPFFRTEFKWAAAPLARDAGLETGIVGYWPTPGLAGPSNPAALFDFEERGVYLARVQRKAACPPDDDACRAATQAVQTVSLNKIAPTKLQAAFASREPCRMQVNFYAQNDPAPGDRRLLGSAALDFTGAAQASIDLAPATTRWHRLEMVMGDCPSPQLKYIKLH